MAKRKSSLSRSTSHAKRIKVARLKETEAEKTARIQQIKTARTSRVTKESSSKRQNRLSRDKNEVASRRERESSSVRTERLTNQRLRSSRERNTAVARQHASENIGFRSAFNYNPNFDYIGYKDVQIGSMVNVCSGCNSLKWRDEPNGLCCASGKIVLDDVPEPPEPIRSLITGDHPKSSHFQNNIRRYNALFQMTSFGAKRIREGDFMPTFKIQGQVYHRIGSLLPPEGSSPQFLQIYFLSDQDQISVRTNIIPNLDVELITQIQAALQENNNYIRSFRHNLDNSSESEDIRMIIHADQRPPNEHRGRYNAPSVNEVAVLLIDEDKGPRDIVVHKRDGQLKRVSELHRSYDALQYPLMFSRGEDGYCINIPQECSFRNKTVSCMQFYAYRLMIKMESFNTVHRFKNLFNQYCVDMMAKIITERLDFIRRNQTKLRAEDYVHLRDAVNEDGNIHAQDIGQHVILPSTFTGSHRYMHEKGQDGMTFVRNFGKPDLFITFTCNPEWPEIKNELFAGQRSYDRHDIIARVFHLKVKKLIKLLTHNAIFGQMKAFLYTIEWQKRGLPHAHILLWLETKIQPDEIDSIICAEIPNSTDDPALHNIVVKNMIHGPCGEHNINSPCMINGICSKRYPRNLLRETQTGEDGYPSYRRRAPIDGGNTTTVTLHGREVSINNSWVVPYSPVLSRFFNAHINIEYCQSVKAIKYICKYVTKGTDQATVSVGNQNEIQTYLNGRYISSSEAAWRILEFNIHERYPTVTHLAVHLENGQRVYFSERNLQQRVENPPCTTLMAFFELCKKDDFAKNLLYSEVPQYFTWANNKFSRRKRGKEVEGHPGIKKDSALGRMYTIHPSQSECFHLRILLQNIRGPTSFECLRTVNGELQPTYKAACKELGLIENDDHWEHTLADAVVSDSPKTLRELFVTILLFCQPSEPIKLWQKFQEDLCEDILHKVRKHQNDITLPFSNEIFNEGLIQIEDKLLQLNDKTLKDFDLPSPQRDNMPLSFLCLAPIRHSSEENLLEEFVSDNLPKLVPDQQVAYDVIIKSVLEDQGKLLFIDAPGGTGKTFLINLILARVRSLGKQALAVASSGIAATLLSGGRTAHSTFKLPLTVSENEHQSCRIRKNGPLGRLLQKACLVVWDECTMSNKHHFEAVNRSMKDIRNSDKTMGGVTFVFAGDFRQTLPVVVRGTRADVIKACLKSSQLWNYVETITLRTNMRAHLGGGDTAFSQKLLQIGNGEEPERDGFIEIDQNVAQTVSSLNELICKVFPDVEKLLDKDCKWICERTILSARNSTVDRINQKISERIPGDEIEYKSIDTVVNVEDTVHYPQEFLNSLNPSGLPPHILKLKIGVPIILLRNLSPPNLCNGTRLQIKALRNNVIESIIISGPAAGQLAHIPRIPMIPNDLPFQFKRLQFPVNISFAITINKSQGQTYKFVGIDLKESCFSHGQLYVSLSRAGSAKNQYILNNPSQNGTKNIVYSEILK